MFQRIRAFLQRIGESMNNMVVAREKWLRTPFRKTHVDIEEIMLNDSEDN